MSPSSPSEAGSIDQREQRGATTRLRLLTTATILFGEKGFASVSVRDIAEAAQTNVAAIAYHFKDKAGLYREAFEFPMEQLMGAAKMLDDPSVSFEQAIRLTYQGFLLPFAENPEGAKAMMKMHHREMVEPSGMMESFVCESAYPLHNVMLGKLQREIDPNAADQGIEPDLHLQRIGFMVFGMATDFYSSGEYIKVFSPGLLDGREAIEALIEDLVRAALAIVAAERHRRLTATVNANPK